MLRPLEEFLWTLRRSGLGLSPAQAIDALRAAEAVGLSDRTTLRDALAAVLVQRAGERRRFDLLFDRFFAEEGSHARDLEGRLRALGFDPDTLGRLREMLEALGESGPDASAGGAALLTALLRGSRLDHRLTSGDVTRALSGLGSPLQAGFFQQRVLSRLAFPAAARELGKLRALLEGEFGRETGERLFRALSDELELARAEVRAFVERAARPDEVEGEGPGQKPGARDKPFVSLSTDEIDEVRRAIRLLAERLRGAARVRERRGLRGRVDPHRTLARAMRTGGVPVRLAFRARRRDRQRLFLLCDVSDSVRSASVFLLEFAAIAQELFDRTRTFVFVSELGETTALFAGKPVAQALSQIFSGAVVSLANNSNYGRVLRQFEDRHGREIDRRSTVVVLGDGRTNYQPPEVEALARLRQRARSLLWLCPEPRGLWGTGDSVMPSYARASSRVLEARTARELEAAARALLTVR